MRALIVLLVVLMLLAVGADRVAAHIAQSRVADGIRKSQQLSTTPDVAIKGFPFLTQLIASHFQGCTVTINGGLGENTDHSVRIASLKADATDIRTSDGYSTVRAGAATGTATIRYDDLSKAVGAAVTYGGSAASGQGRVKVSESVTVLGQKVSGFASAEIVLTGVNMLGFSSVQVEGLNIPQAAVAGLTALYAKELKIDRLPSGLTLQSIKAEPDGITATVSGRDVVLKK